MYGYFFGMSLVWWIFWVALIAAFFVFLTPVPRSNVREREDPLKILKRRYAAGELTTAEFDERRARLLDVSSPVEVRDRIDRVVEHHQTTTPPPPPPLARAPTEEQTRH